MKKPLKIFVWVTLTAFCASCTMYKVVEMDVKKVAAKGEKVKIVGVRTESEAIEFLEEQPARVQDGDVVGLAVDTVIIDAENISEAVRIGKKARIVTKDGDRFEVLSARPLTNGFECAVLRPARIPLEDVRRADVKKVDASDTFLANLALLALPIVLIFVLSGGASDDEEGGPDLSGIFDDVSLSDDTPGPKRSVNCLFLRDKTVRAADETEFWITQWAALGEIEPADGMYEIRLANGSDVPRGVDQVKLVVVDHPPGVGVAPDVKGAIRSISGPVAPSRAIAGADLDVAPLVGAKDGNYWTGSERAAATGADPGKPQTRSGLTLEFPRPAGADKAKLLVNATNTTWRTQFARQNLNLPKRDKSNPAKSPVLSEDEYTKLPVKLATVRGWQTGQVIFGGCPLPAEDTVYPLDLTDVGGDTIKIFLYPPAGYWMIDRLALDFGPDESFEEAWIDANEAIDLNGEEVLAALAEQDGSTVLLEGREAFTVLRFAAPPLADGLVRTCFLRTVDCYEMPPRAADKNGP